MKLFKVSALFLLAGGAAACSHDVSGNQVTLDSLAGLRYVNLVADTSAVDFRIVDVVAGAPNQVAATFRTGGAPEGISTSGFLPIHQPVAAGTRHIRVFMNGNNPTLSSQVVFDTNFTFKSGQNYTFYLYGNARTGSTPGLAALITQDSVPTIAGNNFGVRVLNVAPNISGNPAGVVGNLDGRVALTNAAVPLPGAANFSNLAFGNISGYVTFPISTAGQAYRLALTATGTASPIAVQTTLLVGSNGSATAQPNPGTAVAGTAFTAVLVPRSVTGTLAPQTVASIDSVNTDSLTRIADTAVVWRKIKAATATACASPIAAGAAANDIINISGLTQPEYNGSQAIVSVVAGVAQTLWSVKTLTLTGATGGFTLTFGGATTPVLAPTATAAQVEAALGALSSVGAANVSVSGNAGGPYAVTFQGTFTNTTVGTLSASANGGLTAGIVTSIGCGTAPLVTRDTVSFTGAVATDSFKVTVGAASTPFLVVGAPAATVQAAIAALSTVGAGVGSPVVPNVTVSGTGPYIITYQGQLNNQNVNATASMKAGSVGVIAVAKAAFVFSGAATPNRLKYRIPGAPASPATGIAQFKVVTSATADFSIPTVIYLIDQLPPRTAP